MGDKMTEIEISRNARLETIDKIAKKLGISDEYLEMYGKYKAKISNEVLEKSNKKDGKLILVKLKIF